MNRTDFRPAAIAILALGLSGTAALARSATYVTSAPAAYVAAPAGYAVEAPATVVARPVAVIEADLVPPNVMGQFTCALNERHTRLEHRACGNGSYADPRVRD